MKTEVTSTITNHNDKGNHCRSNVNNKNQSGCIMEYAGCPCVPQEMVACVCSLVVAFVVVLVVVLGGGAAAAASGDSAGDGDLLIMRGACDCMLFVVSCSLWFLCYILRLKC